MGRSRICTKSVPNPMFNPFFASFLRRISSFLQLQWGFPIHHPGCSRVLEDSHCPMHQAPRMIGGFGVPAFQRAQKSDDDAVGAVWIGIGNVNPARPRVVGSNGSKAWQIFGILEKDGKGIIYHVMGPEMGGTPSSHPSEQDFP